MVDTQCDKLAIVGQTTLMTAATDMVGGLVLW